MKLWETLVHAYDSALQSGLCGRKRQMEHFLSKCAHSGFHIREDEAKKTYQAIRKKYREIRVHWLYSDRIGEYCPRYLVAVEDAKKNASQGILDVFVVADCVNHNSRLTRVMGRHIQIIDETNVHVWKYVLRHFPKVNFSNYWNQYRDRNMDRLLKSEQTAQYLALTAEENAEGQYKKSLMGLTDPFVCVASRDSLYLKKQMKKAHSLHNDYRDSDINRLSLSANYLEGKGITTVRMGRDVKDEVTFGNCIDYANQDYDELMDIVLARDCKFFVSDSNGIMLLPMTMNRPVAFKNVVPAFVDGWGTIPYSPHNLFIFKKYYKKAEKRFLTIKEMMEVDQKVQYNGLLYRGLGIDVVENTAEEILDLVIEMNARLDGEWIETPEDIALQKKYRDLFEDWIKRANLHRNAMPHAKLGAMFLRKNPFLLED